VTTYALLVGINEYASPVRSLYGCRNDVAALEEYLRARAEGDIDVRTMLDAEATRPAVVEAFHAHLGRAGPGDVAVFTYSGHGTEEPVPKEIKTSEASGKIQTLMLADSGKRVGGKFVRGLADKELAVLLAEVSGRGAHTVAILDCCHAGGADRDAFTNVRGWTPEPDDVTGEEREMAIELTTARRVEDFLPGTLEQWEPPPARHVALAACQSFEKAKEQKVGTTTRGAFSTALLESLRVLGPRTSYRTLLNTVRARVERATRDQRPVLFPLDAGSAGDALFLDGTVTPVPAAFTMTPSEDGWRIDGGLVHGLRDPVGDDAFVLSCTKHGAPAGEVAGAVRVTTASVGSSLVEAINWTPEDTAYSATVIDVPLPRAEVVFDPPTTGLEIATTDVVTAIGEAIATSGPGGTPSAHVRVVDQDDATPGALRLRVAVPSAGVARITRTDGAAVATDVPSGATDGFAPGAARLVVNRLEHVARWEQVRALGEHPSPLLDVVSLHVFEARPGEQGRPADREELRASGGHCVEYHRAPDKSWMEPYVFLEVRNEGDEQLHVAVLDLTDRYKCQVLQQTELLGAGIVNELASNGTSLTRTCSQSRAVAPGAGSLGLPGRRTGIGTPRSNGKVMPAPSSSVCWSTWHL